MPELPEVETIVRALARELSGKRVAGMRFLGKMRRAHDAKLTRALTGRTIIGVRRRAKYIIIECSGGLGLLAHLGMTGSFRVEPSGAPLRKHDRTAVVFDGGGELRYEDARRFGFVVPVTAPGDGAELPELSGLGVEPLSGSFGANLLRNAVKGRKAPVKTCIMDQRIVVGIGNIYANEALFAAGIDPRRPAGTLAPGEWKRVAREIRSVLRRALERGGSTIRDYRGVDGGEGKFQRELKVYGRAGRPCPVCGSPILAIRQAGRSTFLCPACQT